MNERQQDSLFLDAVHVETRDKTENNQGTHHHSDVGVQTGDKIRVPEIMGNDEPSDKTHRPQQQDQYAQQNMPFPAKRRPGVQVKRTKPINASIDHI